MCDKKDCFKVYYFLCFNLIQLLYGKWECLWYQCDECSSVVVFFCEFCLYLFCKDYEKGVLVFFVLEGCFCCLEYDFMVFVLLEYWSKIKCKWELQDYGEEVKE